MFNFGFLRNFLFNFGRIAADLANNKYKACREVANGLIRVSFQDSTVCWDMGTINNTDLALNSSGRTNTEEIFRDFPN